MRCDVSRLWLLPLAMAAWTACLLGARWERALAVDLSDGMLVYAQGGGDDGPSNGATQRLSSAGATLTAFYSFKNFNQDRLSVEFKLPRSAWGAYDGAFGYYKKDIAEIDAWHNGARQGAYKYAVAQKKGQAALDAALAKLQRERDAKVREYMSSRGFKLEGNVVSVDMPSIVKKNGPVLNSVAAAFDGVAIQRGYGSDALVGAAASLVQTALIYRIPPSIEANGRHTGGIMPPATTMLKGWGDCDTKTALLGSILVNWPQMRVVGVAVPGHYLLAVLRIPNRGDVFIEHEGLQYALVEPAGPAWLPPGQVAQSTLPLLESTEGFKIEPFF